MIKAAPMPTLQVLAIQLRQIQQQLLTVQSNLIGRLDLDLATETRLRTDLHYAVHATTQAAAAAHFAAKSTLSTLTEKDRAEAQEAALRA